MNRFFVTKIFQLILFMFLSLPLFSATYTGKHSLEDSSLEIYLINVGHGDAILIKADDKVVLMDTGFSWKAEKVLLPFLKKMGITNIDYLILTHMHPDHIGGAKKIIENFSIGEVLTNGTSLVGDLDYINFMSALFKYNLPTRAPSYREKLYITPEIWLDFVNKHMGEYLDIDQNNNSMASILHYKDLKVFLAADLARDSQRKIFEEMSSEIASDIYKVHHHGSWKFDPDFIKAIHPKNAVFSGKSYPFGFPSWHLMKLLRKETKSRLHFNDPDTIHISSNGNEYSIENI